MLISIWNAYTRAFKPRYSVERRMGLSLLLDRQSHIDRALLVRGSWETRQIATLTDLIQRHKKPGQRSVFLDIGAHGALYSILAHKSGFFDEVVAFEPDPINCAQLQANLFLNGAVEGVRLVQAAVSEHSGRVTFHRTEALRRGEARLAFDSEGDAHVIGNLTVDAVRIDDLFDLKGALVAVKIDIEGHEVKALAGMTRLLRENDCVLQVESFENQAPALLALLDAQGYRRVGNIVDDYFFERTAPVSSGAMILSA